MHLSFELVVNCVRNWVLNTLGTLREGGCCLLLLLSRLQVARKEARKETAPQELQTGERGGSFCLYRVMFVSCVWLKGCLAKVGSACRRKAAQAFCQQSVGSESLREYEKYILDIYFYIRS